MLSWSSQLLSSWAHLFMDRSVPRETYGYHGWPSDCTVTTLPASWIEDYGLLAWKRITLYLELFWDCLGHPKQWIHCAGLVQRCWSSELIDGPWWGDHRRPSWATIPEAAPILRLCRLCRRKVTLPWHPQIYPPKKKEKHQHETNIES